MRSARLPKPVGKPLGRVLQELRGAHVAFMGGGWYRLLDKPLALTEWDEEPPDEAIEDGLLANRLVLPDVPTDDVIGSGRIRRGQQAVRRLTLQNYRQQCALCDIREAQLLVTAHIVRWADDPAARGDLRNVICLCRFHDVLFEHGYIQLGDDLSVIRRAAVPVFLQLLLDNTHTFRHPQRHTPLAIYLDQHRRRFGP